MQKNDIVRLSITDQSNTGDGIGKVDGFPLFVRHAITGDEADVIVTALKKTYGYGRIKEIISPSKDRVEPPCPVWKRCGGCQLLPMSYEAQLEFKTNQVKQAIRRIGGFTDVEVESALGSDDVFGYRNKAQYPIGKDKEGNICSGFYAGRSHDIIPSKKCLLSPDEYADILEVFIKWMNDYRITPYDEVTKKGIVRHLFIRKGFKTNEVGICVIINAKKLKFADELIAAFKSFENIVSISYSPNLTKSNVIMGDEAICIYGKEYINDKLENVEYAISPLSFYQVNQKQTEKLYNKVKEFAGLKGNEIVWDLYCGIGSISLFMADKAKKVIGVEVIERAVKDAYENAKINGITNAEYYFGDVAVEFPKLYKKEQEGDNLVIIDPPRKGSDEKTLGTIVKMGPEKIVYVSCNPSTLARDLKYLHANGYEINKVQPVDLFPQTVHIETVVLLNIIKE